MAFTVSISINTGTAGQTLKAALFVASTGALTVKDIASTFVEQGGGWYTFTYSLTAGYRDCIGIYTGTIGAGTDFSGITYYGGSTIGAADELRITRGVPTLT